MLVKTRMMFQYLRAYWLLRRSALFDRDFYLKDNPVVAQSGMDPIRHYLKFGAKEGRDPSAGFCTSGYLKRYEDVQISGINPLVHYLRTGEAEGRSPDPYNQKPLPEVEQALPISKLQGSRDNVLLIDFCFGGGTAVYVNNAIINKLPDTTTVFHVKYDRLHSDIHVLVFRGDEYLSDGIYIEIEELIQDLAEIPFSDTIVNTLVTWPSAESVLACIRDLKKKQPGMRVNYKLHDYYCICPSYTLLDDNGSYCGVRCDEAGCADCVRAVREAPVELDHDHAGRYSVTRWRKVWHEFFVETADTISVFSEAAKKILLQAYPDVSEKICFVPHQIPPFKEARIGIIGEMAMHKGADVVKNLIQYMEKRGLNDIRFYWFGKGSVELDSPLLHKMGSYQRAELPELLKKHKISMVFIPSVWPETFCYTAGESLFLGYLTASFDLGGQGDQVRASDHGLLLNSQDPHYLYRTFKKALSFTNPVEEQTTAVEEAAN